MSCAALNASQSFCAIVAAASSRFLGAGAQCRRRQAPMGTVSTGSSARARGLGNGQHPRGRAGQGLPLLYGMYVHPQAPVAEPWMVPMSPRSLGRGGMDTAALRSARDADGDPSVSDKQDTK